MANTVRLPDRFDDTRMFIDSPDTSAQQDGQGVIYGVVRHLSQAWHGAPCIKGTMQLQNAEAYNFSHFDKLDSDYGSQLQANVGQPHYYLCQVKERNHSACYGPRNN